MHCTQYTTILLVPTLAPAIVVRSRGVSSATRGVRVGRVADSAGLRWSRKLAQTACMCVGYQFPLRAVWASTVGSRFKKILRRFVASEVGGSDRQFWTFRYIRPLVNLGNYCKWTDFVFLVRAREHTSKTRSNTCSKRNLHHQCCLSIILVKYCTSLFRHLPYACLVCRGWCHSACLINHAQWRMCSGIYPGTEKKQRSQNKSGSQFLGFTWYVEGVHGVWTIFEQIIGGVT